jgi:hypothetical protein
MLSAVLTATISVAGAGVPKVPAFTPQTTALLSSSYRHLYTAEDTIQCTPDLRAAFDKHFSNPREAHSDRFVWDYWHVTRREEDLPNHAIARDEDRQGWGNQYTFLRSPASEYFEPELFERLCEELTEFGRTQLGCDAISPPWLSLYVDGCSQNFHTDAPHGPYAFVLSLTPDGAHASGDGTAPGWFEGGETTLLQPWVCDYWRGYDPSKGLEFGSLFETVAPLWNRLTVFDSRLPHGVAPVRGTRDPRRGRLVLTGWFSDPQPSISGGLAGPLEGAANEMLAEALASFQETLATDVSSITGFLAVRIDVRSDGSVEGILALGDTLVADPSDNQGPTGVDKEGDTVYDDACGDVRRTLHEALSTVQFPETGRSSAITLPLSFQ